MIAYHRVTDPECHLRTAAWYGDRPLALRFPEDWEVTVAWPSCPPPLSDRQIADALEQPTGQPPLRDLARGKRWPLVIVDDLTRPTPAGRVLPIVLDHFGQAGIPAREVTILMATGTHGAPPPGAIAKKVGPLAASTCRVLVHDDTRDVVDVGRTRFGTPVAVNRQVMRSDLVVGIGGIYPQHSTGFGGGSKLALGVLGRRSIVRLHYGHASMEGSYDVDNDFRRDLDEIARMIGLTTLVSVNVDAERNIFHVNSGDHFAYYTDAVAMVRRAFRAPHPGAADVVVSNTYPIDLSLTFMRSKGIIPLLHAQTSASRIIVASCSEGVGFHGLYPFMRGPRFARPLHVLRKLSAMPVRTIPRVVGTHARRRLRAFMDGRLIRQNPPDIEGRKPIWLYPPGGAPGDLPAGIPGMTAVYAWPDVLERIRLEQTGPQRPRVMVYPCAPLQVIDLVPSIGGEPARQGRASETRAPAVERS